MHNHTTFSGIDKEVLRSSIPENLSWNCTNLPLPFLSIIPYNENHTVLRTFSSTIALTDPLALHTRWTYANQGATTGSWTLSTSKSRFAQ
jgi:hypothetical protein